MSTLQDDSCGRSAEGTWFPAICALLRPAHCGLIEAALTYRLHIGRTLRHPLLPTPWGLLPNSGRNPIGIVGESSCQCE